MINEERLSEQIKRVQGDKNLMELLEIAMSIYPEYRSKRRQRTFFGKKILNVVARIKKKGFKTKEYSTLLNAGGFVYCLFEGAIKLEKK